MEEFHKMSASITGEVVAFPGDDIVVQCENGNVVSGHLGDMVQTIPDHIFENPSGLKVEAEGWATYSSGNILVFLEEASFWREGKFLGSYDENIKDAEDNKPSPKKASAGMNLDM